MQEPGVASDRAVEELRAFTRTTGGLHEVQIQNLKMWPSVIWGVGTKSTFRVVPDEKMISFNVKRKKGTRTLTNEDASWVLAAWAKRILGEEWKVIVRVAGSKKDTEKVFAAGALSDG